MFVPLLSIVCSRNSCGPNFSKARHTVLIFNRQQRVECRYLDVGGPDEFLFPREDVITLVIAFNNEDQTNILPYREDVIVGEEIFVVFTEPFDCSLSLSFDVQMTLEGLDSVLDKKKLYVICEGRTIGIQVDLSVGIESSQLLGRAFEVQIGQVGDESFGPI